MLTVSLKRPKFFNQNIHDYCLKSTNESIRKKIEKYDEERKRKAISLDLNIIEYDFKPKNEAIPFILLISITSFVFYIISKNK